MKEQLLYLQKRKFQLCELKRWYEMEFFWNPLDAVRDTT